MQEMTKDDIRRLKRVHVEKAYQRLDEPIGGRWFRIEGLPDDARIVGVGSDFITASMVFFVWSMEFDRVEEGAEVPLLELVPHVRTFGENVLQEVQKIVDASQKAKEGAPTEDPLFATFRRRQHKTN